VHFFFEYSIEINSRIYDHSFGLSSSVLGVEDSKGGNSSKEGTNLGLLIGLYFTLTSYLLFGALNSSFSLLSVHEVGVLGLLLFKVLKDLLFLLISSMLEKSGLIGGEENSIIYNRRINDII